jgi:hypothetical protein
LRLVAHALADGSTPSIVRLRKNIRQRLTQDNLGRHLRDHDSVQHDTPFISLSAGVVERRRFLETNLAHPALGHGA